MATEAHDAEQDEPGDKDKKVPAGIGLEEGDGADTGEGIPIDEPGDDDEAALRRLEDPDATRPAPSVTLPVRPTPAQGIAAPTAQERTFAEPPTKPGGENAAVLPAPSKPVPAPTPTEPPAKPTQRAFTITLPEPSILRAMGDDDLAALGKEMQQFGADLKPYLDSVKMERAARKTAADQEAAKLSSEIKSLEARLKHAQERAKKLT